MSFHFCSHAWEVQDVDDGTLVRLSRRDLDIETASVIVEELFEVVQESGRPNLHLDFADIRQVASVIMGKLIALDAQLKQHGGRLKVLNLNPMVYESMEAARLTEVLDLHMQSAAETLH